MRRIAVRTGAVVAAAAAVGALTGAVPALAGPEQWPKHATLDYSKPIYRESSTAAEFPIQNCGLIPDGASAEADGWFINQPAVDAQNVRYSFTFLRPDWTAVHVAVDDEGAAGMVSQPGGGTTEWAARDHWYESATPEGVRGGLTPDGVWVQVPAGWRRSVVIEYHDDEWGFYRLDVVGSCPAAA